MTMKVEYCRSRFEYYLGKARPRLYRGVIVFRNQDSRPGLSGSLSPGRDGAHVPLVEWKDAFRALYLALMTPMAWCVPEHYWPGVASGIERLLWRARRQPLPYKREWLEQTARMSADFPAAGSAEKILRGGAAYSHLATLQLLRCYRPGGWHPRMHLAGEDRLRRALDSGRGAILWVLPTATSDIATKLAFHRAGFRVSHLSRYSHGFSVTRFGRRVLNPVRTVVERRFLAERLEIGPAGPFVPGKNGPERAVDAIARRLEAGQIVSITVTDAEARKPRYMPVLNGWLPVGDGPIRLARRTRAALFPVVTIMREDGCLVTNIEPELLVPAAGDRDSAAEEVLGAYGRVLEGYVLRAPDQFSLWYKAVVSPGAPT